MDGLSYNDISMETLQTSIVNAIKAIRSSKKRADELTVYKFVKKELHLITNTDVNNTLKILSEMGRIENKPSKDKSSYFLSDNGITDSEPHISTIMATPLVETSSFTDILSPGVDDKSNSFVSSDTENDNNNSLETPEVIDNGYKYPKYKKIKDVLLPEIKDDIRDFMQNEVKQKTNLHNQEEYQTVVDKKLITNLEREIEFLKSEISTKNEIIKKILNNDICQNKSCNMVGETWDFDVTQDAIVESKNVNTVDTEISNMNINDQLKMIREEKHQEYLLSTGCKSLSSKNTRNNENTKQFSDPQARKENINETAETNKESNWSSGTCAIVNDSMVNGIDEKKLQKHGNVKVFYFSSARINDMNRHLIPIISKRPDYLILHVGTNDATTNTSRKITEKSSIS